MNACEKELKAAAGKLFAEKKIDLLLGFEQGSEPGRCRPRIVRNAGEVEKLVWNDGCSNNLAVYLADFFRKKPAPRGQPPPPLPRVAIVVKGCDALSIALLVRERQVPRANLIVIGMPCQGIRDPDSGKVLPSCEECAHPNAENADLRIAGESRKPSAAVATRIAEFEAQPAEERWRYFVAQVSKCIRCYACRQACPNCYCQECFADQTQPRWIGAGNTLSDTMLYHLGRIFHQAGRCVACDACARACPMDVDLRMFTHKLVKDAKELFAYEAGESPQDVPLFCAFRDSDPNDFTTDPEKKD
jgi:ferredoxin